MKSCVQRFEKLKKTIVLGRGVFGMASGNVLTASTLKRDEKKRRAKIGKARATRVEEI